MIRAILTALLLLAGPGSAHAAIFGGLAVPGLEYATGAGTIELQDMAAEANGSAEAC
jgi:hypothetical protein